MRARWWAASHIPTMPPSDSPQNATASSAELVEQRDHVAAEIFDGVWALGRRGIAETAMVVQEQGERRAEGVLDSHMARVVPSALLMTSIGFAGSPNMEYESSTLIGASPPRGGRSALDRSARRLTRDTRRIERCVELFL